MMNEAELAIHTYQTFTLTSQGNGEKKRFVFRINDMLSAFICPIWLHSRKKPILNVIVGNKMDSIKSPSVQGGGGSNNILTFSSVFGLHQRLCLTTVLLLLVKPYGDA